MESFRQYPGHPEISIQAENSRQLALFAADLSLQHQMSFADSIMYATARQTGVTLVTSDDHFQSLHGVVFIPKPIISRYESPQTL